jgi:hypothetical protein
LLNIPSQIYSLQASTYRPTTSKIVFFKFVGQFAVAAIQPALNQDQAEEMPVNFESFIHPEAISHTNADIDQGGGGSVIMAEYQCSVTGGTKAIFMKQSTNGPMKRLCCAL